MLNKEKYKLFWKQGFIIEKNFLIKMKSRNLIMN